MKPIRVMHFRREVPTGGGPETLILGVSRCIDRARFDFKVAVFGTHSGGASPMVEGLRATDTPVVTVPTRGRFDPRAVGRLARLLDEHEIDVLHTHDHRTNLIAWLAARRRPTPLVATLHQPLRRHWWLWHYEMLDERVVRRFDRILPVADMIRRELVAKRPGLADRTIAVLNGVDLTRFDGQADPERVRAEFSIPPGSILCATVGRLSDDKGLPYLLECARQVLQQRRDVYFLIAGRGPMLETLKARNEAMGLGDRVFFAGFRTDVQDLLTAADMLVVASTSEGCPVVILEAMACGCPVICTRVGGSPEIVYEGVTGHVVEPRQPERLARMILALADDAARRREMGQQAARVAREEFTIERMTRRFEEVYTELAQQDAPR